MSDSTEIANVYAEAVDGSIILNTIDNTTAKGKMECVNVLNNSGSLNDVKMGTILEVVGVITQHATRKGRNNNPDVPCINTYLLCKDGKSYFSQSDGIARNITTIMDVFGGVCAVDDKTPYLPLQITTQTLTNGNTLKGLKFIV